MYQLRAGASLQTALYAIAGAVRDPAELTRLAQLLGLVSSAMSALELPAVTVTSWLRADPSDPHGAGAAVDFAGQNMAETHNLWVWLAKHRRAELGELILEPPRTGVTGHVHLTLPGWGGRGQILEELPGGVYAARDPGALEYSGVATIPGLEVTVDRGPDWRAWLLSVATSVAFWWLTRRRE